MLAGGAVVSVARWSRPWRTLVAVDALPAPGMTASLLRVFRSLDQPAVVGREYLALAPGEADARDLTALIAARLPGGHRALARDTGRLRATVDRCVRADFAAGRVVTVDGWILAATEARLCALAALAVG
jgi:hypothetical protein